MSYQRPCHGSLSGVSLNAHIEQLKSQLKAIFESTSIEIWEVDLVVFSETGANETERETGMSGKCSH